jgi:hypothetical protein
MLDKRIKFDESYISEEHDTITLYFTGPKELLVGDYPEAESMEISIECPREYICAEYANVEISPTRYDEEEDGYTDYDWRDIDLPYDEIEALIKLAEESGRM